MRKWQPLTPQQLALAEQRLRHPTPGSKIEAAQMHGVDLSLLIENLRLSPAERATNMHATAVAAELVRGAALRTRS